MSTFGSGPLGSFPLGGSSNETNPTTDVSPNDTPPPSNGGGTDDATTALFEEQAAVEVGTLSSPVHLFHEEQDDEEDWIDTIIEQVRRSAIDYGAAQTATLQPTAFQAGTTTDPAVVHGEMVKLVRDLEDAVRGANAAQLGHNNPPSAIDDTPALSPQQVAALLRAAEVLRNQPPSPSSVPPEAQEARKSLSRIFVESFVSRAGELTIETLAAWAKTGGRALIWLMIFKLIETSSIWVELIKLASHAK